MDVFWALVDRADVVSTNFAPEVGARLGVDEARVRQRRPSIVYSRISAYGLEGPLRAYRGHEQVGQAVTGMQVRWGTDAPSPLMQPHPVNDFGTGHLAAFAILLALYHRMRTGEGQLVGASLAQTATLLQTPFMLAFDGKRWEEPGGQACRGVSPLARLYQASDGWLFLAARSPEQLAGTVGLEGLDPGCLEADLESRLRHETAACWVERLTAAGVGAHVLNTPEQAMADAWATRQGVSRSVTFPEAGPGVIVGPAPRLSLTPMRPGAPAAPLGWHARELLEELGFGDRVVELVEQRAVTLPS
jgi:crotonobetainyl-CoA:carnitine CoA-transferase CaiB-like acyl-CoA transferase